MSTSPISKQNEEEVNKDPTALVHRSAAPNHKDDEQTPHGNGTPDKQHPSPGQQHDEQGGKGQPPQDPPSIEDSGAAEDDNTMQGHPATQEQAQYETEVKEQDRWLPIANVARIMKTALPDNAKIAKEAKECMQECVSEFISFITSEASEKCQHEKRKTVNGEDIIFAMTSLGFENYSEALRIYLVRYRESNLGKAEAAQAPARSTTPGQGHGHTSSADEHEDAPPGSLSGQAIVPGAVSGVAMSSNFVPTQDADNNTPSGAPYAYSAMSNGGGSHY